MQVRTRAGLPERDLNQSNRIHSVDSEAIPLTNCEAMYQAAVSKRADNTIPSGVLKFVHGHVLFQVQRVAAARAACIEKNISAIIAGQFSMASYVGLLAFLLYAL